MIFESDLLRPAMKRLLAFGGLLGLLIRILAACRLEPERSTSDAASGRAPDSRPVSDDGSRASSAGPSVGYEELLRAIPDTPETRREVYIDDYTVVRRVFDIPLPGPEDDEATLQEFYDWSRPREETLGDTVPVPEPSLFHLQDIEGQDPVWDRRMQLNRERSVHFWWLAVLSRTV